MKDNTLMDNRFQELSALESSNPISKFLSDCSSMDELLIEQIENNLSSLSLWYEGNFLNIEDKGSAQVAALLEFLAAFYASYFSTAETKGDLYRLIPIDSTSDVEYYESRLGDSTTFPATNQTTQAWSTYPTKPSSALNGPVVLVRGAFPSELIVFPWQVTVWAQASVTSSGLLEYLTTPFWVE
jgi:hypothetical protein